MGNLVCTATLKSWTNTNQRVTPHFKAGTATLHSNPVLSVNRASLLGWSLFVQPKVGQDSGSCRPALCRHSRAHESLQNQIWIQWVWAGGAGLRVCIFNQLPGDTGALVLGSHFE